MGKNKQRAILARKQNNTAIFAASRSSTFIGPLPPPEILDRYNQVVPGMAERLMRDFEKQTDHRMFIEKQVIRSKIIQSYIGQTTGFVLGLTGLVFGYALIHAGKDGTGIASILGSLSWLGGIFVVGKLKQSKDLKKKEQNLTNPDHS